jgi:segregation and condensation protein B
MLKQTPDEVREALHQLKDSLSLRGIRLLVANDEYSLVTAPEASELISEIIKEELSKDLSKSAVETLSIILYKGKVTRSDIDYIRGVNSTFILRNLLIRGLVEKTDNPNDQRSFLYQPTADLLKLLGITSLQDLPKYEETIKKLDEFILSAVDSNASDVISRDGETTDREDSETVAADENTASELADTEEYDESGEGYRDEDFKHNLQQHEQPS